jgi:hypothetical protein
MLAVGEKAREPLLYVRDGVRCAHTDGIEAARLHLANERLPDVSRIVQKSRLA